MRRRRTDSLVRRRVTAWLRPLSTSAACLKVSHGNDLHQRQPGRPNLRGEVSLPRLAVERSLQIISLYENWPTALMDRLGLRRQRSGHVLYRIRKGPGPAELVARTNGSDVRTIGEIWIGSLYDRFVDIASVGGHRPVVVDIGANCGYFAVYAARRYSGAQIICFEPDADNRALATVNLMLNGIEAEVRSEAVVVGARETVTLHLSDDPRLHTTVGKADAAGHGIDAARYTGRSVEVPAVDVNDALGCIVAKHPIDLLKIDVEGIDLDLVTALRPANLAQVRCIVAETEGSPTDRAVEHLEDSGYSVLEDARLLFARRG